MMIYTVDKRVNAIPKLDSELRKSVMLQRPSKPLMLNSTNVTFKEVKLKLNSVSLKIN